MTCPTALPAQAPTTDRHAGRKSFAYISVKDPFWRIAKSDICKLQDRRWQLAHICEPEAHNMITLHLLCQAPSHHFVQSLLFTLCLASQLSTAMTESSNVLFHVGYLILLPPELLHLCILKLCSSPHICIIVACMSRMATMKVLLLCMMRMAECLRSSAGLHSKQLHPACVQPCLQHPFLCGYMLTAICHGAVVLRRFGQSLCNRAQVHKGTAAALNSDSVATAIWIMKTAMFAFSRRAAADAHLHNISASSGACG